jgi:hypothetical protein
VIVGIKLNVLADTKFDDLFHDDRSE